MKRTKLSALLYGWMGFCCCILPFASFAQNTSSGVSRISGIVKTATDSSTIPGAAVAWSGNAKVATTTDAQGRFSLLLPSGTSLSNAVLNISFIGYEKKEVKLHSGETEIQVVLKEAEANSLNDVVVTALGITRSRKSLGYAVTEVKGSDLTQAREVNVANALEGKVAGVNVSSLATGPGGSSRVVIRGAKSFGSDNQPLYVINGLPLDNTSLAAPITGNTTGLNADRGDGIGGINPDDIETMTVLKGGTAAALYGSRAAFGAIVITTKKGRVQKGIGVDYNSTVTIETPAIVPDWQYEYGQGKFGAKVATQEDAINFGRLSYGAKIDGSSAIQFDGVERPYVAQKNNIRNFYTTGTTFTNTVAFSGGSEKFTFRVSASDQDNQGIVPHSTLNKKIVNMNLNANLSRQLSVEASAQYNVERARNRPGLGDAPGNPNWGTYMIANTVDVRSLAPGYDSSGNEILWNSSGFATNPYFAINRFQNSDTKNRFIGYLSIKYNLLPNLFVKGRVARDRYDYNYIGIIPTGTAYLPLGEYHQVQSTVAETNSELTLNYNTTFLKHFHANVLAGANRRENKVDQTNIDGSQFNTPFFYSYTNVNILTTTPFYGQQRVNSLFGSLDVDYKNIFFLNVTGRNDWFSTLSPASNHIFYPSVGGSFLLSEVLRMPYWINYAKLRGSWAATGGGTPTPYQINQSYSNIQGGFNGQPLQQVSLTNGITQVPNAGLKPFKTTTTELGTEWKFLNNRLGLDLGLYTTTTKSDIVPSTISPASGYGSALLNVGMIRNRGIEILLTAMPVKTRNFSWEVAYNYSYNDNKVLSLGNGLSSLLLGSGVNDYASIYAYVGRPFGVISGYRMAKDAKGQVIRTDDGREIRGAFGELGQGIAPIATGITNSFNYKRFNLSFLVDGKFGNKLYSATNLYATRFGLQKMTLPGRENGLPVTGVDQNGNPLSVTVPVTGIADYYNNWNNFTDKFVYDASFIKLRQVIVGYSIPVNKIKLLKLQSLNISFVARNLLILYKKVPNVDPESTYTNTNVQGIEMFSVPRTRSYGINLMVKF